MKIISFRFLSAWRYAFCAGCDFLVEQCFVRPIWGLIEIGKGLMLAVPAMASATKQAIEARLSAESCLRFREGLECLRNGWLLLRWPLLVALLFLVWYCQGVFFAVSYGPMLVVGL